MTSNMYAFADAQTSTLALEVGCEHERLGLLEVEESKVRTRKIRGHIKKQVTRRGFSEVVHAKYAVSPRRRHYYALPVEAAEYLSANDISDEELAEFDMGQ